MALQGFDKSYYLNAKLAALQTEFPEWGDKDTAFLENLLINTYGLTAEMHYSMFGYLEGLEPNNFFIHDEYRFAKAVDLIAKGFYSSTESALDAFDAAWTGDMYLHYLQYGASEGINPSNSFDETQYLTDKLNALQTNASTSAQWTGETVDSLRSFLTGVGMTVVDHYINFGENEGLTVTSVPAEEQVDPAYTPWILPHDNVSLPSSLSLEWVDNTDIATDPHQAIGQVTVTTAGFISIGTGFMISPEHVLTNAHMVLDDAGRLNSNAVITFTPGLNGDASAAASYGYEEAWVEKNFGTYLYPEWPDDDLAIIKLSEPIGDTFGYLSLEPDINLSLSGISVQSAGYSAGRIEQDDPATPGQDYYQWEVSGTVDQYIFDNGVLELSDSMDVTAGASGSPIYYS
ncbi:MAG: trypsin-like peptidase domain-containing protein, partial [Desulfobacteraceae bacterium]|nr:trypsin-like peptidase domain-containing protein [Desulfobacteraceae bacterium]